MTPLTFGKTLSGRWRLLVHSLTSVIDQAGLSALNLLLGLALIRWTSKAEYGLYAQLYVASLFAVSMLESVIINPLTTLAPTMTRSRRARFIAHLSRFQRRVTLIVSLLFGTITAFLLWWLKVPEAGAIALAFAAYVGTSGMREFQRGLGFLQGQPGLVLRTDALFAGVTVIGVIVMWLTDHLTLVAVLTVLAVANALAWASTPRQPRAPGGAAAAREALATVWQRGRLGLPGALSSWAINYSYLFLAAAWLGVTAAADLNAARLLLMPVSLLVVAWSRVARPQLSRAMAVRDLPQVRQLLLVSVTGLTVAALLYLLPLWWLLPWLQTHVLGPDYGHVQHLIWPWAIYFVLYLWHMVGSATLLSADRYHQLLAAALASLPVMALALLALLPLQGTAGAVQALILVEVFNLVLLAFVFLPAVWRSLARPPSG